MAQEEKHVNSKKVKIFRAQTFLGRAQVGLDDYYAMSQKDIGSYWDSKSGTKVGSGMDFEEIDLLLPLVIDVEAKDRDFKAKSRQFFQDISTKVPHKEGVELEVGLRTDNSKPVSADNLPINVMEYLRFRHAIRHPWVAGSRDESEGNQLKHFYLYDPEKLRLNTINLRETKEKALEAYLVLTKEKVERMDDVLAIMGEDPRGFKDKNEKLDFLESKANSTNIEEVSNFLTIANDKSIEMKGFINKLVQTGILRMVGSRYLVTETDKILADGIEELLIEFADTEKNGQLINVFKAQLQEKMKAKINRLPRKQA